MDRGLGHRSLASELPNHFLLLPSHMTRNLSLCRRALAVVLATTLFPLAAAAAGGPTLDEVIRDLRKGGHVIVFRHGATYRDQAEKTPIDLEDPSRQRL